MQDRNLMIKSILAHLSNEFLIEWPEYGSFITIETYKDEETGEYFNRFLFKDEVISINPENNNLINMNDFPVLGIMENTNEIFNKYFN